MAGELYYLDETFGDHFNRGRVAKPQPRKTKTAYCDHYENCDKEINCFDGEDCPFFKFNPDCVRPRPQEKEPIGPEEEFERILEE